MKYIMFFFVVIGCLVGGFFVVQALIGSANVMQQVTYAVLALAVSFIPFALFCGVAVLSGGRERCAVPNMPPPVALNE